VYRRLDENGTPREFSVPVAFSLSVNSPGPRHFCSATLDPRLLCPICLYYSLLLMGLPTFLLIPSPISDMP